MFGNVLQVTGINGAVAASQAGMQATIDQAQRVQDGLVMSVEAMKVLTPFIQSRIMRPDQHSKAGRIVVRMSEAGYSKQQINDVVGALVGIRDSDMQAAFDLFAGADGVIDAEEMKTVVPLIGENLDPESIRCLFTQADKDKSGKIEFGEFCQMMYSLTPKAQPGGLLERTVELTQAQEALAAALLAVDADPTNQEAVKTLGNCYGKLIFSEVVIQELTAEQNSVPLFSPQFVMKTSFDGFNKSGMALTAAANLIPEVQVRIFRPKDYQRAGRIVQRMNAFEKRKFDRKQINDVLMSLLAYDDKEMIPAFQLWAGEDGRIDAGELREVIPMLGEDLNAEEINAMFKQADKDGSGFIEQSEFVTLMNQMQMKGDGMDRYLVVGAARAQAYATSKIPAS